MTESRKVTAFCHRRELTAVIGNLALATGHYAQNDEGGSFGRQAELPSLVTAVLTRIAGAEVVSIGRQ